MPFCNHYFCFISVVALVVAADVVDALRHNFVVHQDARTLIAPIGAPYGFVQGGSFGFDVTRFDLHAGKKRKFYKIGNNQYDAGYTTHNSDEEEAAVLQKLDAGFLLKRFASETAFAKYTETVMANTSACIFDSFIEKSHDTNNDQGLFLDDDNYYNDNTVGDIDASGDGIFLPVRWHNSTWQHRAASASIRYTFETKREEGLYFLLYQVCIPTEYEYIPTRITKKKPELRSSFEIEFHYKNVDLLGEDSYLTAGELPLPLLFFYFFASYTTITILWMSNIYQIQKTGGPGFFISKHQVAALSSLPAKIFAIHHLMSLLLVFKSLTVLFESIRYHYIRATGHAEFWSVAYYSLSFLKSLFLFTVVLLIGSGWSFVKPFLNRREKWLICGVLVLQVLDNIALLILNTESEGESLYDDWSAVLHMLDIVCCAAILVPIVWQVNALEKSLEDDDTEDNGNHDEEEEAEEQQQSSQQQHHQQTTTSKTKTLEKLKLFRTFYIIVVAYIYLTRIAVYLFATLLDYRHTWVRTLFLEMATLAFYVAMGLQFRPMTENPYLTLSDATTNDEYDDDEYDNHREVAVATEIEMKTTKKTTTNLRSSKAV